MSNSWDPYIVPTEELASLFLIDPLWTVEISQFDEVYHVVWKDGSATESGHADFAFYMNPRRLEWRALEFAEGYQEEGRYTSLFPLISPWLQEHEFKYIVIRDYFIPDPFLARGFQIISDPADESEEAKEVLAIDLRDEDRPSLEWVNDE